MVDRLRHRGPDGCGVVTRGRVALGHTRLAIMDPAGGAQPLRQGDGDRYVVANGEIYNHAELRRRFAGRHRFATGSDAEVLLPVSEGPAEAGMRQLDGMFSFVVSDGQGLLAARDPLGIKPLYYGRRGDSLRFASEVGALVEEVDAVQIFPPGHCYVEGRGLVPYHHLPRRAGWVRDLAAARRLVRETLAAAVRSHLMADVPVGAFLSGGLDSTLLALLARRELPELHTFAVGLPGSPDLAAAEQAAAVIGSRHHRCELSRDLVAEALEEIVGALESYDAALVRSAVPTWFVARLAAGTTTDAGRRIKVVLTGEGADELFAGYEYLRPLRGAALEDELHRLLTALHHLNLQRVDRMTMAHGLEARVPFLATGVVDRFLRIHPDLKAAAALGREKGLLRMAFDGELPRELLWRPKQEFAQGSSVSALLAGIAAARVSEREWHEAQEAGLPVASREELCYYRILERRLGGRIPAGVIGRWQGPVL
ncbi:MAG: asparagine synthetase B [Verrucomicrobia bacterium]|nr:asparagine synthetase B [Verrucomicrobiota bacterium]